MGARPLGGSMSWKGHLRGFGAGALMWMSLIAGMTSTFAGRARPGPPGDHLTIQSVIIDPAIGLNGQLIIRGEHFDFRGSPSVTIGDLPAPLNIAFSSSRMLVVDLPPGPPLTGDLLLTVSTGNGQSQNDEYDLTFGAEGPEGPQGPPGPQGPQGVPGPTDASGLVFYETDEVSIIIPEGEFRETQSVSCDSGDIILSPASMNVFNHAVPFFDLNAWSWKRTSTDTIEFFFETFDTCDQSIGCILASDLRGLCLDATP